MTAVLALFFILPGAADAAPRKPVVEKRGSWEDGADEADEADWAEGRDVEGRGGIGVAKGERPFYNGDRDEKPAAGAVARERLGVSAQSVDPALAEALGLKPDRGALVTSVLPGGPGAAAGLKRGDVIIEVDDARVRDVEGLAEAYAGVKPGRETDVTLMRGIKTLEVTLVPRRMIPAAGWDDGERERPRGERLGIRVAEPDRALRRRYGIGSGEGVIVLGVSEGSRAEAAGLREGDFIIEAERRPMRSPKVLQQAVAHGRKHGKMVLFIRRGEDALYVPIRFD